ncbi:MAG: sulfatase [Flavobacteriaceae bacterium]
MKTLFYCLIAVVIIQCRPREEKSTQEDARPPNILFVLVDDQRNDALSCAGHSIIQTPTVDLLAEKGIRFTNAYVTTSICAASRASILTGLYENRHNYTFGKAPLKTKFSANSYPYLLRKAGYSTGFVGKFGVALEKQDSMIHQMFDFFKPSPINMPHFVTLEDGSQKHSAEIWGDEAIAFINDQNTEKPFCLSLSFNAVHAVDNNLTPGNEGHYPYPKSVAHLYEDVEIPQPRLSDPQIYDDHPEFLKKSLNRVRYYWRWDTEEKYQINMKAYYRMISGYDNVLKRVIKTLKTRGFDKNTIIVFSADNGYYMGNRGFAGKWSHYEESLRVPLIIYDPRNIKEEKHRVSKEMVLNIDIPSTILDYARVGPPETYQGKSMVDLVNGQNRPNWREDFICEHRMDHPEIPKYYGLHEKRYVYANYYEQDPPYEYLHDLKSDPEQLNNLTDSQEYQEILQKMRAKSKLLLEQP